MTRIWTPLTLVLALAFPALADSPRPRPLGWALDAAQRGNWDSAQVLAAKDGQIASDIITWMQLRDGQGDYPRIAAFLGRRPDWPGLAYLREQSEAAVIAAGPRAVLEFFADAAPQTPQGAFAFAQALIQSGRRPEAEARLALAWRTMPMDAALHDQALRDFAAMLAPHHAARLDALLWQGNQAMATAMLPLVSPDLRALAKARLALRSDAAGVDQLIRAVPAPLAGDPGLAYDRVLWRLRKGFGDTAMDLLLERSASAVRLGRPEAWAGQRRWLARAEIRNGRARRAYDIAAQHHLQPGSDYADLEWLAGFIALRKLNDPKTALAHFNRLDAAVASPISQGRAGYWRGRALAALGQVAAADQAYLAAAQHQTSFYGLLAAEQAGAPFDMGQVFAPPPGTWHSARFVQDPLFQAGLLLQASGRRSLAERFWTHMAEGLDAQGAALLGQAALELNLPHLAVMIGKRVAQRGIVIPLAYYPLHPLATQRLAMAPEMVLAIARRESEFDPWVQSHVGARGLMQLMPATASEVAAKLGLSAQHSTARLLSDPMYNGVLGAAYLASLAGRFDGNVVMMAAGYNAGPSRPIQWMQEQGDPRNGQTDMIDWIEMIPFSETRNYVMRVTESLPIYRARLGKPALPVPFSQELRGSGLAAFAPKGE